MSISKLRKSFRERPSARSPASTPSTRKSRSLADNRSKALIGIVSRNSAGGSDGRQPSHQRSSGLHSSYFLRHVRGIRRYWLSTINDQA